MIMKGANEKWRLTKAELMRTGVCLCGLLADSLGLPFSHRLTHVSRCPKIQKTKASSQAVEGDVRSEREST